MLRVPLDGHAEGVSLQFNALGKAVFADGGAQQIFPQAIHGLMMNAVDHGLFPQKAAKAGVGGQAYLMLPFCSCRKTGMTAALGIGNVLKKGASQAHVHHLHAAANAQYGLALIQHAAQEYGLGGVPEGVGLAAFFRGRLSVEFGSHVGASGQQQPVAGGRFFRRPLYVL